MKTTIFLILFFSFFFLSGCAQPSADSKTTGMDMIQAPAKYSYDCTGSDCQNLMVVGDSISLGYLKPLAAELTSNFNVYHPEENCRNSWYTLQNIDSWLNSSKSPDVIIWNNGIWNVVREELSTQPGQIREQYGTTLEQYESDLRAIGMKLKATNARVIFLTTTAIDSARTENYFDTQKINQLNDVAYRVMSELGIEVKDLHAESLTIQDELFDGIHFSAAGNSKIAKFISSAF